MLTIDNYIDLARERSEIASDGKLCRALGVSRPTVSSWRTKRNWPSDETMVQLADLAKIERETALLHLNAWRSEGVARTIYTGMLAKAIAVCFAFFLIATGQSQVVEAKGISPVERPAITAATIYYGKY